MTNIETMKLALEGLEKWRWGDDPRSAKKYIFALTQAIEQESTTCNPHPKAPHGFNRNASHSNDRYTCDCEGWDAYEAGYQDGLQKGLEMEQAQQEQDPLMASLKNLKREVCDAVGKKHFAPNQAIEQAQQAEPVAIVDSTITGHIDWLCTFFPKQGTKLYTSPPPRQPLTVTEEMVTAALKAAHLLDTPISRKDMRRAIESDNAKHGEQK